MGNVAGNGRWWSGGFVGSVEKESIRVLQSSALANVGIRDSFSFFQQRSVRLGGKLGMVLEIIAG